MRHVPRPRVLGGWADLTGLGGLPGTVEGRSGRERLQDLILAQSERCLELFYETESIAIRHARWIVSSETLT